MKIKTVLTFKIRVKTNTDTLSADTITKARFALVCPAIELSTVTDMIGNAHGANAVSMPAISEINANPIIMVFILAFSPLTEPRSERLAGLSSHSYKL